jgi:hypothetical protein
LEEKLNAVRAAVDSETASIQSKVIALESALKAESDFHAEFDSKLRSTLETTAKIVDTNVARLRGEFAGELQAVTTRLATTVVSTVDDALRGPALHNYQGFACATLTTRAGGDDGNSTLTHDLTVWVQPNPDPAAMSRPISIRDGVDANELSFDLAVRGLGIDVDRPRDLVSVRTSDAYGSTRAKFVCTSTQANPPVEVHVLQGRRLLQILRPTPNPPMRERAELGGLPGVAKLEPNKEHPPTAEGA